MAKKLRHGRPVVWINHNRKKLSKQQRERIFIRDHYTCQLCKKDLSDLPGERVVDHKIPLSQFGSNKNNNLWLLCLKCDKEKKSEILPVVLESYIFELKKRIKK